MHSLYVVHFVTVVVPKTPLQSKSFCVLFCQVKVSLVLDTTAWTTGPYATPPVSIVLLAAKQTHDAHCKQHHQVHLQSSYVAVVYSHMPGLPP